MLKTTLAGVVFAALLAFGVAQPASAQLLNNNNPLSNFVTGAGAGYGTAKVFGANEGTARGVGAGLGALNALTTPPPQQQYYYQNQPQPQQQYYPAQAYNSGPNCAPRMIAGAWCNVPACWKACGGTYRSFQEWDCTVVPTGSYRQRCYK